MLVDSNIVSYRYRQSPEFAAFQSYLQGSVPAISAITYGECLSGARAAWSEQRVSAYDAYLRKYLLLPVDREVVMTYARTVAANAKVGISLGENDWWIAATALRFGIPLLTNDQAFRMIHGLTVLPPLASKTP